MSKWNLSKPTWVPRPEQERGVELITRGEGARLFLHPGKGKTSIVLKSFQILKALGYVDHLFVLAPLRVVSTSWPAQIEYWEDFKDLTYSLVHGERQEALEVDADVYLMNNEGLIGKTFRGKDDKPTKYIKEWLKNHRCMLVVDESTKFKNSGSSRFKLLKLILPHFTYNTILTGTPKPNNLEDLFSQCYLTDGGRDLGQYITHFRHNYMQRRFDGFGFDPQKGAVEKVAEKIAPTTLQLEYEEALPSQVIPIWIPMPEAMRKPYEELRAEFITVLGDSTVIAPNTGALLNKLRQLCQGAMYAEGGSIIDVHSAKLDALESLLAELDGEPLFCLTQFKHDVARISERLGYAAPYLGSGASVTQGSNWVTEFSHGRIPLLCGHPLSVAHGIDGLQQSCSNVVWFGNDYAYENVYQANLRVVRSGNKAEQVFIYQIMVDCPIEHAILASVSDKKASEANFCDLLRSHLSTTNEELEKC
jgi:hypothetical protein